ncbi:hypothetical protein [Methylogaea oryzae]|uniref:TnsE C-terminal domain-containing protein n=2 Tax=Methylogaea oryzae TaxID=1295382 RepID=A0A8D4VPX0_9GAMM|nr:hypothetical protein [Methylogaea oryzae]BBL71542.1 hypothetical protein MoryE10_21480 [Methylogaea oryzae]
MAVPFNRELKRVSKAARLQDHLPEGNRNWMAWWYCGIYKNRVADSQPHVLVAFREWSSGALSDEVSHRRVPLTALGQIRLGTIWREGVCHSEAIYDTARFSLDFTPGAWRLTSFDEAAKQGHAAPPYPHSLYPLKYRGDKNWLIAFELLTGGTLVVPCIEFFSRCYGRSEELKRILTTYEWHGEDQAYTSRLYAPLGESEEPGKWKVKLKRRLVNGDVVFLAHAKYDSYTEQIAKDIYGQLESQYDPNNKAPTFIRVAPWFQGPAELKVNGIWFNDRRSFLALQVLGCSDPKGAPLQRDRENTNKADQPAREEGLGEAWAGAPVRRSVKTPEIVDLTGDEEPDHGAAMVEIQDPDFEVLGEPRTVIDVRRDRAKDAAGARSKGSHATSFSSGEPYGSEKGVGYASIHARPVMDSNGILQDMWNAMQFLSKNRPGLILSAEWFTFADGFNTDDKPKLIRLRPFDDKTIVKGDIRTWPYLDVITRQELRGVLVTRLMTCGKAVYIVEIQRRVRKTKTVEGEIKDDEESFKGLVFTLNKPEVFETWLISFLRDIRAVKGIVQRIVANCPGKAAAFKHVPANNERVPCEAAVLNALEKVGVQV